MTEEQLIKKAIELTEEQETAVADALRRLDALRSIGVMLVLDREYDQLHAINVSSFSEIYYMCYPDECPDGMVQVPYYENEPLHLPVVSEFSDDFIVAKIKRENHNLFAR